MTGVTVGAVLIVARAVAPDNEFGAVLGWVLRAVFLVGIIALLVEAVIEFRRGYSGKDSA